MGVEYCGWGRDDIVYNSFLMENKNSISSLYKKPEVFLGDIGIADLIDVEMLTIADIDRANSTFLNIQHF